MKKLRSEKLRADFLLPQEQVLLIKNFLSRPACRQKSLPRNSGVAPVGVKIRSSIKGVPDKDPARPLPLFF